jgi:uncharacterized protein (DUF433 family)
MVSCGGLAARQSRPADALPCQACPYVETHNGGYYVAGTRIGLDVVTHDFRRGRSAEAIFEAYPSIGSLAEVYGAITFILDHPAEIDAYLKDQERIFEESRLRNVRTVKPRGSLGQPAAKLLGRCPSLAPDASDLWSQIRARAGAITALTGGRMRTFSVSDIKSWPVPPEMIECFERPQERKAG